MICHYIFICCYYQVSYKFFIKILVLLSCFYKIYKYITKYEDNVSKFKQNTYIFLRIRNVRNLIVFIRMSPNCESIEDIFIDMLKIFCRLSELYILQSQNNFLTFFSLIVSGKFVYLIVQNNN